MSMDLIADPDQGISLTGEQMAFSTSKQVHQSSHPASLIEITNLCVAEPSPANSPHRTEYCTTIFDHQIQ